MDEIKFKIGEIVWVHVSKRLGWWPGHVENIQRLRQEIKADVTSDTIAVVRYLNEDNYNIVKDKKTIYPYNHEQKDEFITYGMSKFKFVLKI